MMQRLICVLALTTLASGCGHTQSGGSATFPEVQAAPVWVTANCQDAFVGDEVVLCGVGSMTGTRNPSLACNAAMARARTDLARTLQVKVKAMVKDYQSVTTDGVGADDEQHVVDVSKQVTSANLRGTRGADVDLGGGHLLGVGRAGSGDV